MLSPSNRGSYETPSGPTAGSKKKKGVYNLSKLRVIIFMGRLANDVTHHVGPVLLTGMQSRRATCSVCPEA